MHSQSHLVGPPAIAALVTRHEHEGSRAPVRERLLQPLVEAAQKVLDGSLGLSPRRELAYAAAVIALLGQID